MQLSSFVFFNQGRGAKIELLVGTGKNMMIKKNIIIEKRRWGGGAKTSIIWIINTPALDIFDIIIFFKWLFLQVPRP